MDVYKKVVAEDGSESYELVDPAQVELPEDHPVNVKLRRVTDEAIERRKKIKALETQLSTLKEDGDEEPAPKTATQPPTALNPEEIAKMVREQLRAEMTAEAQASQTRLASIDAIMSETGLPQSLRPVIEAIPDPTVARAQAVLLAQSGLQFEDAPAEGNGQRDVDALLKGVSKRLKLV